MPGRRGPRDLALPRAGTPGGPAATPSVTLTGTAEFPELRIEWMPDSGPGAADGTWVSLTEYVAAGQVSRGRNYELDAFEAGTLTVELVTATRLFDPDNTAGAYYGKLLPMRQIRMLAAWQGIWYPIFRGFITSWGTTSVADVKFSTTITARDAFVVLEQRQLPSSAWALEIVKDNPSGWFRLGESETSRVTDSSPNGNYGVYDNCEQGVAGLVVNDADGAVSFAHSQEERVTIQNPNLITGYPFVVSAMIEIGAEDPGGFKTIFAGYPGAPTSINSPGIVFGVTAASASVTPGVLYAKVYDGSATRIAVSRLIVADGLPHHVVWVASSSSTHQFYVDGVAVTTSLSGGAASWPGAPTNGFTIGNITDIGGGDYGFGNNDAGQSAASLAQGGWYVVSSRGTIDEVVVWDGTVPSATRFAAHAAAALTGWAEDDTGARVSRFLDALAWPAGLRTVETGISRLGPADWSAGSSVLSVLQGWAETELGQFFIDREGRIVWRSRHYPLTDMASTRSNGVFGDGRNGETLVYADDGFELVRDESLIRNPVQASRKNGVKLAVRDDYYADQVYGDRTWSSPETQDSTDAAVRDRAVWLLNRYKALASRLRSMRLQPRRNPNQLWPQVLGRELGDRITVQRHPAGLDTMVSVDQIIERVSHRFSPTTWETVWQGSPVDPNVGSYLILDDEVTGLLDSGLLAY